MHGSQGTSRPNQFLEDGVETEIRYNTTKKDWWTPENPTNEYYSNNANANAGVYSINLYENDSFIRIKDVSLSYDVPTNLLEKVKLSKVRFYLNARNPFTITKWSGLDPELDKQTGMPLQKEYTFGLSVGL